MERSTVLNVGTFTMKKRNVTVPCMEVCLTEHELDCMECELYFQDHPNYRKGKIRTRKE